jgi:hypothetical protein
MASLITEGQTRIRGCPGAIFTVLGRQLYDIVSGTRHGLSAQLMQKVIVNLTTDDIVAISDFLA